MSYETLIALDIPIVIHVIVLIILLNNLAKYHNYQMKKFRPSMIFFAGYEVFMTLIIVSVFMFNEDPES